MLTRDNAPGPDGNFWAGIINAAGIYLVVTGLIILIGHLM